MHCHALQCFSFLLKICVFFLYTEISNNSYGTVKTHSEYHLEYSVSRPLATKPSPVSDRVHRYLDI